MNRGSKSRIQGGPLGGNNRPVRGRVQGRGGDFQSNEKGDTKSNTRPQHQQAYSKSEKITQKRLETEDRDAPVNAIPQTLEFGGTRFNLADGGIVDFYPNFLSKSEADQLYETLRYDKETPSIPWEQGYVIILGERCKEPRLSTFLGEREGIVYTYANKKNVSSKWPHIVFLLKNRLEVLAKHSFNACLCNWYQDGQHCINWHGDSEAELVENAFIASLSLGSTRKFQLRHYSVEEKLEMQQKLVDKMKTTTSEEISLTAKDKELLKFDAKKDTERFKEWDLHHGDLILMGGTLQKFWKHQVPRTSEPVGPRINLTFRYVKAEYFVEGEVEQN